MGWNHTAAGRTPSRAMRETMQPPEKFPRHPACPFFVEDRTSLALTYFCKTRQISASKNDCARYPISSWFCATDWPPKSLTRSTSARGSQSEERHEGRSRRAPFCCFRLCPRPIYQDRSPSCLWPCKRQLRHQVRFHAAPHSPTGRCQGHRLCDCGSGTMLGLR